MDNFFLLLAYTVGTVFGLYVGSKIGSRLIIERTIDELISKRFIKTKTVNGELELLRYDEE